MKTMHLGIAAMGALALSGCVSFGAKPPKSLLTLTPATTVTLQQTRTAAPGQTITIMAPAAPAALMTNRVPVYDGTPVLAYVKDAAWNDNPASLFQRLLSETVAAKTGKIVLDLRQYTNDPGTRVSGSLIEFGIDARAMQAVVSYDAVIARTPEQIETRRFESRVPVSAIDPASIGAPLNQAANNVAAQVAGWIGG